MLNIFPTLLFLGLLGPALLRIAVGIFYLLLAWKMMGNDSPFTKVLGNKTWTLILGGITTLFSLSLIAGFYTQLASIAGLIVVVFLGFLKKKNPKLPIYELSFLVLSAIVLVSLVVTGAGAIAFDLPL